MNKFFTILTIGILFFCKAEASNTKLIKGNSYEGQIKWKFVKFNLPKGNWIYYAKRGWNFYNFNGGCVFLISISKKIIMGHFEICHVDSGGKLRSQFGALLQGEWKNNEYGNCSFRPEFFYAKFKFKGASTNCFITRHINPKKELYFPDDPNTNTASLKKYIKDNDLIVPITLLQSESIYFSSRKDRAYSVSIAINPEFYGAPKSLNGSVIKSEYHRGNIKKYPIKNKFIIDWTKQMSNEHKFLEKQMKANIDFKLDFGDIASVKNNDEDVNLVEQIKNLNELFKSGALTKEEFEKAKKKLLN